MSAAGATVDDDRAFISQMEDADQVALRRDLESDDVFATGIRLERHSRELTRSEEVRIVYKVPFLAETRDGQPIYRFGLFRGEDAPEPWKWRPAGQAIMVSQRTVVRRGDGTPALMNSGWAHSAPYREGHYLDVGIVICGHDPDTMLGKTDLRSELPKAAVCQRCLHIVTRSNGSPPHSHRWLDASVMGDAAFVCRCGAKQAEAER